MLWVKPYKAYSMGDANIDMHMFMLDINVYDIYWYDH